MERFETNIVEDYKEQETLHNTDESISAKERVRDIFQQVDQDIIRDIFLDTLRKAGSEKKIDRMVSPDEVEIIYDLKFPGRAGFLPSSGNGLKPKIFINAGKIKSEHVDDELFSVIHAYIHEQVHAVSNDPKKQTQYNPDSDIWRVGFFEKEVPLMSGVTQKRFGGINEGMTELITDRFVKEYFTRTGQIETSLTDINQIGNSMDTYFDERYDVEKIIKQFSEEYDVPEDVVFNALIKIFIERDSEYSSFGEFIRMQHPDLYQRHK